MDVFGWKIYELFVGDTELMEDTSEKQTKLKN